MFRANYAVVSVTADMVTIEDLKTGKSVTNDAETVVAELLAKYGKRRIFYYGTLGNLDELCHDGLRFTHFAPAGLSRRET